MSKVFEERLWNIQVLKKVEPKSDDIFIKIILENSIGKLETEYLKCHHPYMSAFSHKGCYCELGALRDDENEALYVFVINKENYEYTVRYIIDETFWSDFDYDSIKDICRIEYSPGADSYHEFPGFRGSFILEFNIAETDVYDILNQVNEILS